MSKPVILTGLRANNALHIGNYLGGLLPIVDMAKEKSGEYQINLFVPDLHSFTTPIDHSRLQAQIMQNIRTYIAAGLPTDNDSVFLYRQSHIPAHSELTVILNGFTGMGEMARMTQFKDKSSSMHEERVSVGLFDYPVLMAADILLYQAKYVPVGDDQTQHLEFTRDIAQRMNSRFGDLFTVPEEVSKQHEFFGKDQGLRIRDLQNPGKKMSKSASTDKGVIFLLDTPEAAKKKIMSAATDSLENVQHDYQNQPGVSNLLDLLKLFGGNPDDFIGASHYGPLKVAVADKVAGFLTELQARLATVEDATLQQLLKRSETAMDDQANKTLRKVQNAVGLR